MQKNQVELSFGGCPGITPDNLDPFIDVLRQYIMGKKKIKLELQNEIRDKLKDDFAMNQSVAIGYIRAVLPDELKFYSDLYVRYINQKLKNVPEEIQSDLKKARGPSIRIKIGRFISE
jgi:hypothetical protein